MLSDFTVTANAIAGATSKTIGEISTIAEVRRIYEGPLRREAQE